MMNNGYIYKGLKPVYWCADCETALAEAEVEYADISSDSIYVKFVVENEQELYKKAGITSSNKLNSIIWTTTTWTLPGNLAVCLGPDYNYSFVKCQDEIYVLATELIESVVKDAGIETDTVSP